MRSPKSLRQWVRELLPTAGGGAQQAGWELLRALLLGFTVQLSQLARQLDRDSTAKSARQRLDRWLDRPHWEPTCLYARLLHLTAPVFRGRGRVGLLIDWTTLADGWQVLQVSVPFQGRALPLLRLVRPYPGPASTAAGTARTQQELLAAALLFLRQHCPELRHRAVLIMDRGFPSHALVRWLQGTGWHYVLRVKDNWKLTHPEHTGLLRDLSGVGTTPRLLREGVLGDRTKGERSRVRHCRSHLVAWRGAGAAEAWFLVTSETDAPEVVRLYRQRMQIECEFRDLKGPLGLDALATWRHEAHVARFLAWMAVYEWRLAFLWLHRRLQSYARRWQIKGTLSWIRTTREWLAHLLRTGRFQPDACL